MSEDSIAKQVRRLRQSCTEQLSLTHLNLCMQQGFISGLAAGRCRAFEHAAAVLCLLQLRTLINLPALYGVQT